MSNLRAPLERYRLPPRRHRVQDLHGPWSAAGSQWLDPSHATERWEHGQLIEVSSAERHAALTRSWEADRTEHARVGPLTPTDAPLAARQAEATHRWQGRLRRAFEHVGCKAAHLSALSPEGMRPFEAIGDAILAARTQPRGGVLRGLLDTYRGDEARLYADLDATDRALDATQPDRPWIFDAVPEHCVRLWPLRNVMRMVEQQGVLFRRMPFAAYEAEDSFVPDLPIACLDDAIYGGGFDHDLFHQLLPVCPPDDLFHFEASMLVVESAGQAYNSLVLASRVDGPAYAGHATWPGEALFERLAQAFGRHTVPELVAGYGLLGLVCHPDLEGDPVSTWSALMPPGSVRTTLASLTADHARYVRLDTAWLRTLHPRYSAPIMARWRGPLSDRIASSPDDVITALYDLLWALEDIDLRRHDSALVGLASESLQRGRWIWMRALELDHLLERQGARRPDVLRDAVDTLAALNQTQRAHVDACRSLTHQRPAARDTELGADLAATTTALAAELTRETARVESIAATLRAEQREGALNGPSVPAPFTTNHRELFAGSEYRLPEHIGADGPGAPP